MSKTYDTTMKDLIEAAPAEWVAALGQPIDPAKVAAIEADVSVVTADADKVIRVDDGVPWILHLEFQSSHETSLARRLLRYNALLQHRHGCSVASVVYLLRKAANASDITGELAVATPIGPAWTFRYTVIRVWEVPVETWLTGGLRLLPLAPLSSVSKGDVPAVIDRMKRRLDVEAPEVVKRHLWAMTELLMGLRFDADYIERLLEGIGHMEESTIYQMILERGKKVGHTSGVVEGSVREARQMLLYIGTKKFGVAMPTTNAKLNSISKAELFEELGARLLDVETWDELLDGM